MSNRVWSMVLALAAATGPVLALRADMVILKDGTRRVGIAAQQAGDVTLRSARPGATAPVVISADTVDRVLKDADEQAAIAVLDDAVELVRLADAYYDAGLELPAARCVRRAAQRDAALLRGPRQVEPAARREFWNRTLLELLSEREPRNEADAQLALARWARRADLKDESVKLLRRAYQLDARKPEILDLAREWEVDLRPAVTIDLLPALNEPYVLPTILDEGIGLTPRAGQVFVAVPFRYRRDAAIELRRSTIEIKPVPPGPSRVFGFRPLVAEGGRYVMSRNQTAPLFERLEVTLNAANRAGLSGVNTAGPPKSDNGKESPRAGGGGARARLPCTGWAAVIAEVPDGTESLSIVPAKSASLRVPMSVLRDSSIAPENVNDPGSPLVERLLRDVTHPTPAVAMLSLERLLRMRRELQPSSYAGWAARVDPGLVELLAAGDDELERLAWRSLIEFGPIQAETVTAIRGLAAPARLGAVRLIGESLPGNPDNAFIAENAVAVLRGLLQTDDAAVCQAGLELLARGAPDAAYGTLVGASRTARSTAILRLRAGVDQAVREKMLRSLLAGVTQEDSQAVADLIRSNKLEIADPADPQLTQLLADPDSRSRAGRLHILQTVSLAPVLRSERFAEVVSNAFSPRATEDERRAAVELVIEQSSQRVGDPVHGAFPALVADDLNDVVLSTLRRTAGGGPDEPRRDAVLALLREGDVFNAAKTVGDAFVKGDALLAFLTELAAAPGASDVDGLYALLSRLLGPSDRTTAAGIVRLLDRLDAERDARDAARISLCVKSGLNWESLADFSRGPQRELAESAGRWVSRLAHFSPQDRTQFFAADALDLRIRRLRDAGGRLGRIVWGKYHVVAVLEIAWPAAPTVNGPAWHPPRRLTLSGGQIEMKARAAGREFQVYLGGELLGFGIVQSGSSGLISPEDWVPRIAVAPPDFLVSPTASDNDRLAPPLVLAFGEAPSARAPGTFNINAAGVIRAVLAADANRTRRLGLAGWSAPQNVLVSFRHVGFGTYLGSTARRPLPTSRPAGEDPTPALINVAIFLEHARDWRDSSAPTTQTATP